MTRAVGAAAAFEAALDPAVRRARGVHFTPARQVAWVVGAVIVHPWHAALARARSVEALDALHARLAAWRVLDPACGAGAFLVAAWEALGAIERRLLARRAALGGGGRVPARRLSRGQLLGIELDPAALALARAALPGARLEAGDALLDGAGARRPWPSADAVVGNPPFLGAKRIAPDRGVAWARALRAAMPEVPAMADLCVHFLRRAHDHLPPCTRADPLAGRGGLVLTRNARSGASRAGGLDAVVQDGTIVEAWDHVAWPGSAQVSVSIACWVKTRDPALLPRRRRLWSCAAGAPASASVPHLDASLRAAPAPGRAPAGLAPLACNRAPKRCFQGVIPGYAGFLVGSRAAARLRADSAAVVRPYLTGRELLAGAGPRRFVIDFGSLGASAAARFPSALAHVRERVLPAARDALARAERAGSGMAAARREHLGRYWQLWNRRDALRAALSGRDRYLACARVARRPLFLFVRAEVVPSDLVQVFALDDLYSFGVLQSRHHAAWARARGSRLRVERDVRYAVREVFETFPWPQGPRFRGPPARAVERVARAAARLLAAREEALRRRGGGLRELARAVERGEAGPVAAAQRALDRAVAAAYGLAPRDPVAGLEGLHREVAARVARGAPVVAPGPPRVSR